ncbi:MAG: geranylgeranylglyceryl/heptaprenylglyceryl phosphate synthase [Candidatus Aenigmarchaeota archaeon ex4484_52]|nr:MAG: geranylgeranylglyceryl/heptaprenylglyceryl phosphate synthase [Candidatus Aenigmarchaeota archaeon ex4484_52]
MFNYKGKVEAYIRDIINQGKGVFMGLIDPCKYCKEKTYKIAEFLKKGGADIILIGGSIGAEGEDLSAVAKKIKENLDIPLNIFPGNVGNLTKYTDSVYFMSLLNSSNPYWITQAPALGTYTIKKYNIEPLPTAYLVFEPGQTVGWVGEAKLIPINKPDIALSYALAAQYFGMRFIILESGSGAPSPIPTEIVSAIRKNTDLIIVIAGGVKTPQQAHKLIKAGANCIHIGTKLENGNNILNKIKAFGEAIHSV